MEYIQKFESYLNQSLIKLDYYPKRNYSDSDAKRELNSTLAIAKSKGMMKEYTIQNGPANISGERVFQAHLVSDKTKVELQSYFDKIVSSEEIYSIK